MATNLKDAIIQGLIKKVILDWIDQHRKDTQTMNFLDGYKTYIIVILLLVINVLHLFGINIPGFTGTYDVGNVLATALALISARQGARGDAAKALALSGNVALNSSTPVADAKTIIASASSK